MELPKPTGQRFENVLLRPSDLGDKERTITILSVGPADEHFQQFSNLQIKCEMDGLEYVFPFHTDKSFYMTLHDRFGGNPENWVGKKVKIRSRFSTKQQSDFIEACREPKKK